MDKNVNDYITQCDHHSEKRQLKESERKHKNIAFHLICECREIFLAWWCLNECLRMGRNRLSLSILQEMVKDREALHAAVHAVTKNHTRLSNWTTIRHRPGSQGGTEPQAEERAVQWAQRNGRHILGKLQYLVWPVRDCTGEETRKNNGGSDDSQSSQPSLSFVLYCEMENIET